MQERHVTAGGRTYPLPDPFFVLATQNPIEQEGTYPLPEAQLDRFMLNIRVPYPTADEELEILKQTTGDGFEPQVDALGRADRGDFRTWCGACRCPNTSFFYARDLVRASRPRRARGDSEWCEVRLLGCRPAGRAIADSRRQDPGRARRPSQPRSPTCAMSPGPCCATASSPRSTPKPKESTPKGHCPSARGNSSRHRTGRREIGG